MRTIFRTGLLAAAAFLVAAACGPASAPLTVMTFNIHAGHGDLDAVAEVIRAAGADLVGLQEVDVHWDERSGFEDQAAILAEATGMEVRFAPIYTLAASSPGAPERRYGVAVLSRVPVVESTNHPLTRGSTQTVGPPAPLPGFLEVVVDIGGRRLRVYATHLDYRPDPSIRRAQVGEMVEIIGRRGGPAILLGDLNAPPDAAELQPLFTLLRDVWTADADGSTYPADVPAKRIDYVLASPDIGARSSRVVESHASDHRPVVAELALPSR